LKTVFRVKVSGLVELGVAPEVVVMPPVIEHCIWLWEVWRVIVDGKVKVIVLY